MTNKINLDDVFVDPPARKKLPKSSQYYLAQTDKLVIQMPDERWYITMGHAGYNSPANNGFGYETEAKAMAAHRRYKGRSKE